jgi:hypothetical protein
MTNDMIIRKIFFLSNFIENYSSRNHKKRLPSMNTDDDFFLSSVLFVPRQQMTRKKYHSLYFSMEFSENYLRGFLAIWNEAMEKFRYNEHVAWGSFCGIYCVISKMWAKLLPVFPAAIISSPPLITQHQI